MTAASGKRIAQCGCGALTATVSGDPVTVYSCSCVNCQRKSGSVFTYAAVFPSAAVTLRRRAQGLAAHRRFRPLDREHVLPDLRHHGRLPLPKAVPGMTGMPVGCFADPDFAPPLRLYWASRRHRWLTFHNDLTLLDTQDG